MFVARLLRGEPGLGDPLGEPGRREVLGGVPFVGGCGHGGLGEVDHGVADAGGDLLLVAPEGRRGGRR
ncbi:MAG: hypothetical protein ACRDRR_21990 [Pseudonocardiaceae bacterium]